MQGIHDQLGFNWFPSWMLHKQASQWTTPHQTWGGGVWPLLARPPRTLSASWCASQSSPFIAGIANPLVLRASSSKSARTARCRLSWSQCTTTIECRVL